MLVPVNYSISLLPFSLNTIDYEKIKALIDKKSRDFLSVLSGTQKFAVGVKIYAFLNQVCSVRIIIMRMQQSQNEKPLEEVAEHEEPEHKEKP